MKERSLIWIVEDDEKIARLLESYLKRYGYQIQIATQFDRIAEQFQTIAPDLVLLDVNLPLYDGYYWCKQIRTLSTCPILFISARDHKLDQVMALEYGADDYLTKPFDYEIVLAKIKSHLRRAYGIYAHQGERTIEVAGLTLYPERLLLTIREQTVDLSHKEATFMQCLMERPMRVVSREKLLDRLWDEQHFIDDNTLNVYVTRVRKKLRELGVDQAIETVRGVGYQLIVNWRETKCD